MTLLLACPTTLLRLGSVLRFRTVTSAVLAQLEHGGDLYVQTPAGLVAWGEWQKERAAERAVFITTSRAIRGVVTA